MRYKTSTNDCIINNESYKEISNAEIVDLFKNNKYTFFDGGRITFKPIGYINNNYYKIQADDYDKRLLHQLNIINTKKIINDLEYQISFNLREIEANCNIDINKRYNIMVDGIPCSYSIKELVLEYKLTPNTEISQIKNNKLVEIGSKDIYIDDDLKQVILANIFKAEFKQLFHVVYSYNLLKCYKNRLDNIIFNGV